MTALTLQSKLDVSHLSIQADGDEYTVGDVTTEEFIRIPYEGVAAIRRMDGTRSLEEVQALLLEEEQIEVELLEFAEVLLELQLVYRLDGVVLKPLPDVPIEQKLRWTQPIGKILFGKVAVAVYLLFAFASLLMMVVFPPLVPHFQDMFVFSSVGISILLVFVWTWTMLAFHEAAHVLAAAAVGVPVKLKLSVRWFFVVVEAEMNGLWAQQRRSRYVPFLAGICWEVTVLFVSLLLQFFLPEGGFLHRFCQMTAMVMVYQLLSQFLIFLRNDMYFVLITATNAADLSGDAKRFLKRIFLRTKRAVQEWNALSDVQRRQARWFGVLYAVGGLVLVLMFGWVTLPTSLTAIFGAWDEVTTHSSSSLVFWDGAAFLVVCLLQAAVYLYGWWSRFVVPRLARNSAGTAIEKDSI